MFQWYVIVGLIAGYLWANRAKIRDGTFFNFSRESMTSGILVLLVGGGMLLVPYLALKISEIRLKVSDACVEDIRNLDTLEAGVLQGDSLTGNASMDREITVCGGSADELSRRIALPSNEVSAVFTAKVRSGTPSRAMRIYAVNAVVRDYADIGDKRYGVQNVTVDGVERHVIQLESQGTGPKLANQAGLVRRREDVKPGKDRCYATTPTIYTFEQFKHKFVASVEFWIATNEKKVPVAACR